MPRTSKGWMILFGLWTLVTLSLHMLFVCETVGPPGNVSTPPSFVVVDKPAAARTGNEPAPSTTNPMESVRVPEVWTTVASLIARNQTLYSKYPRLFFVHHAKTGGSDVNKNILQAAVNERPQDIFWAHMSAKVPDTQPVIEYYALIGGSTTSLLNEATTGKNRCRFLVGKARVSCTHALHNDVASLPFPFSWKDWVDVSRASVVCTRPCSEAGGIPMYGKFMKWARNPLTQATSVPALVKNLADLVTNQVQKVGGAKADVVPVERVLSEARSSSKAQFVSSHFVFWGSHALLFPSMYNSPDDEEWDSSNHPMAFPRSRLPSDDFVYLLSLRDPVSHILSLSAFMTWRLESNATLKSFYERSCRGFSTSCSLLARLSPLAYDTALRDAADAELEALGDNPSTPTPIITHLINGAVATVREHFIVLRMESLDNDKSWMRPLVGAPPLKLEKAERANVAKSKDRTIPAATLKSIAMAPLTLIETRLYVQLLEIHFEQAALFRAAAARRTRQ